VETNITKRLAMVSKTLNANNIAPLAYKKFVEVTPIAQQNIKGRNYGQSGFAKANTRLENTTINADYNYADVLNKGRGYRDGQMRGSDQAPEGMTKPTIEYIRDYIQRTTDVTVTHYGDYWYI